MSLTPEVIKRIEELEKKYAVMGQDSSNYLTYRAAQFVIPVIHILLTL